MKNVTIIKQYPNLLWLIQLAYTAIILLANWFDIRMIQLWGIATDAGTLIFPFTFLLSDLITEVYGYKFARRAIWAGFGFNLVFILYSQLVVHLPSPSYAVATNNQFDSLVGFNVRIILASTISYLCAEPINSFIMAKMKLTTHGKLIWLRFVVSTAIAAFIDSFVFGMLAFYHTMPTVSLLKFNLSMWLIKLAIEIIGLPLSLAVVHKLKQYEQLDIYDAGTKFSLFSLEANYSSSQNHYKQP
jgi:hypothetical protein